MSTFVFREGKAISFGEYMLTESFNPSPVEYGTNKECNDGKIDFDKGMYYTFFKGNDAFYAVSIIPAHIGNFTNELGFGVSKEYSPDVSDYDINKIATTKALKVFNNVFYIALKIAKKKNYSEVSFSGANNKLDKMYSLMVKNKSFLRSIEKYGYEYVGMEYVNGVDYYTIAKK